MWHWWSSVFPGPTPQTAPPTGRWPCLWLTVAPRRRRSESFPWRDEILSRIATKWSRQHSRTLCPSVVFFCPQNNFVTTEIAKGVTVGQLLSSIMPGTWRQKLTCLHNEVTKGQWNVNMSASVTLAWWVCVTPNEKCWQHSLQFHCAQRTPEQVWLYPSCGSST